MHAPDAASAWSRGSVIALAFVVIAIPALHLISYLSSDRGPVDRLGWLLWPIVVLFAAAAMTFSGDGHPFIYFRF